MFNSTICMKKDPKNIIVRMPNWLGDFVMATPILQDLKNHWPQAAITALCQGPLTQILHADPHVDQILSFKKPKDWFNKKETLDILDPLKNGKFDLGILLTHSFSSAWWFWRANIPTRMGFRSHWRSLLLNVPVPFPSNHDSQHLVKTYKMLLDPLGMPISNTSPTLYLTDAEKTQAKKHLDLLGVKSDSILIGINPGAAYGTAKCWIPERFRQVTEKLLKNPKIVLLYFGDQMGLPLVNEICRDLNRVINLAGKTTLRELMAFIQECHLFLTNDSGPMHLASALNVPLLALFGSTSHATTGPYKKGKVIHKQVPCSPCYRRECPIDFRCMKQIEVNEVYQNLIEMLNTK